MKLVQTWSLIGLILWLSASASAQAVEGEELETTIQALRARLRDQERRIAELEDARVQQDPRQAYQEFLEQARTQAQSQSQSRPQDMRVYWRDGLRLDSADGNFKMRIGGRIHNDWWWITGSDVERGLSTNLQDGVRFRRARINMQGELYSDLVFKAQFDFGDGSASFKDVYIGMRNLPFVGAVTVGQFKEPFSLEELTSSNYITFIERSLANVFSPSRNVGIRANNTALDNRITWAIGMFRDVDAQGFTEADGGYNLTARVTANPWNEDGGRQIVHLGMAYSLRAPRGTVRYRQRPELRISQRFTDTGSFAADWLHLLGAEAAIVYGPFSLQGEYMTAVASGAPAANDPCFHGAYVQASYFLTGEHRPYSASSGSFGRVKPDRNFRQDGGWGALELAARYSYLDLNDGAVRGGIGQGVTVGLNWYLNPNMRIMANYIRSHTRRDTWSGWSDAFAMRFQVDF